MQQVTDALNEVKDLYQKLTGAPAPEIQPPSFLPFPPGVDPLDHAVREAEDLKRLAERLADRPDPIAWVPRADSFIGRDAWTYLVEVPGLTREQLKVVLSGGECVVRGERKLPETVSHVQPLAMERPWGTFERRFALPPDAKAEDVSARYSEGVLEVRALVKGEGQTPEQAVEVH